MKEVEVLDEKGNLVETLERPECWGEMTEDTDERGCDDCTYCEECMEATSDIVEESLEKHRKSDNKRTAQP